jgi:nitrite reductase/ring-hydroxylating ferredoxin subunit
MRPRNGLLIVGGLVALMALAACAAPAEPVVTTPDIALAAGTEAAPGGASAAQPLPTTPVENTVIPPPPPAVTGPISATPLRVARVGDVVTIPLSAVADVINTEFGISVNDRSLDFMAYVLDGELYVRASACPPCSSLAYALDGGTLLCLACDTRFDAWTGEGIDGACVDYPKAAVAYEVTGDLVTMKVADLVLAWNETVFEGSGPLPEGSIVVAEAPEAAPARPSCCG